MTKLINRMIKKFCRKSTYIKAFIALVSAIAVIAQFIKQSFFKEKPGETLAALAVLFYVVYSDVNEHFILAIAMFSCLYFSYDTISELIKSEVKNRNDQIYKELSGNVEKQIERVVNKKADLIELKKLVKEVSSINDAYLASIKIAASRFASNSIVERNINMILLEELAYLDFFYGSKKEIFENSNSSFDKDSEFTNSKLEEIE